MKQIVILFISLCLFGCKQKFKEGDLVFQQSQSRQSSLIQKATGSKWTHCGIIIEKDGGLYVLEASKTVQLTPFDQWKARGKGGSIKSRRVMDDTLKIKYQKYLGKSYDLAFRFNNNKWYCSELIYDIYKNQFGVELCKPRKVKEYQIEDMEKQMRKRGITQEQLVVAPSDLL